MKNILFIFLMLFSITFFSSCGDKKANDNTSKDTITIVKTDTTKKIKKDTIQKIVEKKDTTSTVRQTEKTQVEEP